MFEIGGDAGAVRCRVGEGAGWGEKSGVEAGEKAGEGYGGHLV